MIKRQIISYDKKPITIFEWEQSKPKAIIQFVHGKGDSPLRYKEFFEYLHQRGYLVFAIGLRAHFASDEASLGLGYNGIWEDTLKDMATVSKEFEQKYPDTKFFVIGQGYGSFLAQSFAQRYQKYVSAMVLGGCFKRSNIGVNRLICSLLHKCRGENYISPMVNRLSQCSWHKGDLTYLSSSYEEIEKYANDKEVGFDFNCSFFKSYFSGIVSSFKKENLEKLQSQLAILILGGENDALGCNGKTARKLKMLYDNLGIKGVKLKLYSDAKHDYLLDKSKEEARVDIANFFDDLI